MTPQDRQDREDVFVANVALGTDAATSYVAANDAKRKPWLTWKLAILAMLAEIAAVVLLYKMVCG